MDDSLQWGLLTNRFMCVLSPTFALFSIAAMSLRTSRFSALRSTAAAYLQACLQTSCWVVQLREHGAVPAGLGVVTGPTTTQVFWQFMSCVSQLTKQAVDAGDDSNGVGASGIGATCCASRIRSAPNAVELPKAASSIASCRMYLIEASIAARQMAARQPLLNHNKIIIRSGCRAQPWA
jgi:hypothetical protein